MAIAILEPSLRHCQPVPEEILVLHFQVVKGSPSEGDKGPRQFSRDQ